jgi:hypothetical protein
MTRKQLAARCEREVLAGVARAIRGREPGDLDPHLDDGTDDGDEIDAAA